MFRGLWIHRFWVKLHVENDPGRLRFKDRIFRLPGSAVKTKKRLDKVESEISTIKKSISLERRKAAVQKKGKPHHTKKYNFHNAKWL